MKPLTSESIHKQPKPTTSISNVLAIPFSASIDTLCPHKEKKRSIESKNCHEAEHTTKVVDNMSKKMHFTIFDSSNDGCKVTKYRDDFEKVSDKNTKENFEQEVALTKGKQMIRKPYKLQGDLEKDKVKKATSQVTIPYVF